MNQYYYKKLSLQHQILYRKMHDAIKRQNEFILCGENECSEEEYYRVLDAILLDNPYIFYVMPRGLSFEQTMWGLIKVKIEYIVDKNKREALKEDLAKQVNQLLN